MEGLFTAWRW